MINSGFQIHSSVSNPFYSELFRFQICNFYGILAWFQMPNIINCYYVILDVNKNDRYE